MLFVSQSLTCLFTRPGAPNCLLSITPSYLLHLPITELLTNPSTCLGTYLPNLTPITITNITHSLVCLGMRLKINAIK